MKYAKSLRFEEEPNYAYIKEQLKEMFEEKGYKYDNDFDWTIANDGPRKRNSVFLHLLSKQQELGNKDNSKEPGNNSLAEEKKHDWKKSRLMKASAPQLLKAPYEQNTNSLAVNYTSNIIDPSPRDIHDRSPGEGPVKTSPINESPANDVEAVGNNKVKVSEKCRCLLL